jgi:hypothetical protein
MFLWIFYIQMFFVLYVRPKTKYKIVVDDMDVGPYRPGTSPIQQWWEVVPMPQYAEDYQVVEQNLEGLTADIPDMPLEEVPWCDQCHTVGVSGSMSRLLCRVSRAVVCYRECHTWHHFVEAMSFRFWHFGLWTNFL